MTIKDIQSIVCDHYNIQPEYLQNPTRGDENICLPRQLIMYLSRVYLGLSFKICGRYYNRKPHTAMHAKKVVIDQYYFNRKFASKIDVIEKRIMQEIQYQSKESEYIDLLSIAINNTLDLAI